jgi:Coatomer (COPI) alpha subunit C-terminus
VYNLTGLEDLLKKGYRSVTEGKFNDALSRFNAILHIIPLLVVDTRREVDDVKELLGIAKCAICLRLLMLMTTVTAAMAHCSSENGQLESHCQPCTCTSTKPLLCCQTRALGILGSNGSAFLCREYNIALRTELARKQTGADNVNRAAELAAYFTHAKLQPMHQVSVCSRSRIASCSSSTCEDVSLLDPVSMAGMGINMGAMLLPLQALSLRNAMSMFYKIKNFKTCSTFCRRLLELNPSAQVWTNDHHGLQILCTQLYILLHAAGMSANPAVLLYCRQLRRRGRCLRHARRRRRILCS